VSSGSDRRTPGVDTDSTVAVGVIRRSHGVRGEASVELLTDSASRFEELDRVFLVDPKRETVLDAAVVSARPHGERALVRLAGIDSPEDVSRFRNWTIEIPEHEARALDENEFFLHDLIGLDVVDRDGKAIGRVVDVIEGVAQLLLRVETEPGPRFDIPFVEALCPEVDLDQGRLTVDLPEGLIELNREGQ
jgi:16S rRNA processing protein RimM